MGRLFTKNWKFLIFWAAFPEAIEMKFYTAKRTQVPVGPAKFDPNRCNESPLRGEKPDFGPVSKFTGSLPLRGNPAGNKVKLEVSIANHIKLPGLTHRQHILTC